MSTETFLQCDALDADGNPCPSRVLQAVQGSTPVGWSMISMTMPAATEPAPSIFSILDDPAFKPMIDKAIESPEYGPAFQALLHRLQEQPPTFHPYTYTRYATICDRHALPAFKAVSAAEMVPSPVALGSCI